MDTQDLKKKLIALRNSIQDYLDNISLDLNMDEAEKKSPEKDEKKPEDKPKGKKLEEDD